MTRLSDLPLYIIKISKNYYRNTRNGKYIHFSRLSEYLSDNSKTDTKTVKEYWWTKD